MLTVPFGAGTRPRGPRRSGTSGGGGGTSAGNSLGGSTPASSSGAASTASSFGAGLFSFAAFFSLLRRLRSFCSGPRLICFLFLFFFGLSVSSPSALTTPSTPSGCSSPTPGGACSPFFSSSSVFTNSTASFSDSSNRPTTGARGSPSGPAVLGAVAASEGPDSCRSFSRIGAASSARSVRAPTHDRRISNPRLSWLLTKKPPQYRSRIRRMDLQPAQLTAPSSCSKVKHKRHRTIQSPA